MTLASKTQPPALPLACLRRPRLHARLDESIGYRVTTVVAGAGFGKSTLLSDWCSSTSCAWYAIDTSDTNVTRFAHGLTTALQRVVRDFPSDFATSGPTPGQAAPRDERRGEAVAALLAESLQELLRDDIVLVLDDVQDVGPTGPAGRLIEALCRHAPGRLHILLASREEPPFAVERLRRAGHLLALTGGDLAFSRDEVRTLLETSLATTSPELADSLYNLTLGWPAAVRLAVEALNAKGPEAARDVLEGFSRPGGTLFGYLAEEVLGREAPTVRRFLRQVAPFERVSVELCDVLGVKGAERILGGFLRRGLFVQLHGEAGDWFRLHALIREFLLGAWPLQERERSALLHRAAVWFERQGQLDEACRCLRQAADPRAIARFVSARGDELVAAGAAELVVGTAQLVPPELRDARFEEVVGEAHVIRGEFTEALECFLRAAGPQDRLSPGLALRMGRLYLDAGRLGEALDVCRRARLDGAHPRDEAILLSCMASAQLFTGDRESYRGTSARAFELAQSTQDPHALAAVHGLLMAETMATDHEAADAHYRSALEWAERGHDVFTILRVRANRAAQLHAEGSSEDAVRELEEVMRLAELAGYTEILARARVNRGFARFHLGRLEEAIADLEEARAIYRKSGSNRILWPVIFLGAVFRERGDLALARALLEEARDMVERASEVQSRVHAQSQLACLLAPEDPEHARSLAEDAVSVARSWDHVLPTALVAAGWVALSLGDRKAAAGFAVEAEAESRERRLRPGLADALELRAVSSDEPATRRGLLEQAIGLWRDSRNPIGEAKAELALARLSDDAASASRARAARLRLESLGVRPDGAAGAAGLLHSLPPQSPPTLAIRTLGGFQVLRDGKVVQLAEWKSRQARDVLKILVSQRGRPVTRPSLMDLLWPGDSHDSLAKRLSVVLTTLRTVLDPNRRFPLDHFISSDKAGIRLQTSHVALDVESFLTEASRGLSLEREGRPTEARGVLTGAESNYSGEFLEESPYDDWAGSLREEVRARYVAVARSLARAATNDGETDTAIRYFLRILERQPYDEEAHLELVRVLTATGRHGEARRAYQTYVGRMQDLTVEPSSFPVA
jgi:ATP/maltotriose-dependent transcriptional regulator MalT/DNA-binding SARP family transcriptional activator